MDVQVHDKPSSRRLHVKPVSPGEWGLFEADGTRLFPSRAFESPARALNAARNFMELEKLLAGYWLQPECR